jgi:hypothetical protein
MVKDNKGIYLLRYFLMKTPVFFLYLMFVFPALYWCQGPGYMGKRTLVGYGVHANPVTYGSTANNTTLFGDKDGTAETGYFRLNFSQELFIERVVGTRWLLGASFKYMRTGYDNRVDLSNGRPGPTDYYKINVLAITPYFKHYSRRSIAPWGKYVLMGPSVSVMRSKHDAFMYSLQTVNNHDTLITDFGSDDQKHYRFDLLLGSGRNRIFFNKLSVDYGYNFQLFALLSTLVPAYTFSSDRPVQQEYISETIKVRVRNANRFNFFVKVAYLF